MRMRWLQRFVVPLVFVAARLVAADTPPPLPFETHELGNGLKVVLAKDSSRPVINLQVWFHVGSKDERPGRTGFAHLFEHIMFRGSKNVAPGQHFQYVRQAGGVNNAYTSFDQTVYYETFPSNYLERMLWLEADRMDSLTIDEEGFQKEREVVKEERRMRYENPPYGTLMEDVLAATYQVYPYKHQPIGSMVDLNKASLADVKDFFETFYVPNNATLVIVGDFEPAEALALAKKHFGRIPRGKKPVPRVTVTEPPQTAYRELTKSYNNAPLPAVINAYHLPPLGDPDSYPLRIAAAILSNGQSSRIYKRLVYDEQSAVAAAGQAIELEGPSLFFGYGIVNQGKNVQEVSSSLQVVFESMRKEPVSDEELTKAKNQVIAGYIFGGQSMEQKAAALGRASVLLGDPARYNTELAKFQSVTAADVQRVCEKYLAPTNQTRLFVVPQAPPPKGEPK